MKCTTEVSDSNFDRRRHFDFILVLAVNFYGLFIIANNYWSTTKKVARKFSSHLYSFVTHFTSILFIRHRLKSTAQNSSNSTLLGVVDGASECFADVSPNFGTVSSSILNAGPYAMIFFAIRLHFQQLSLSP